MMTDPTQEAFWSCPVCYDLLCKPCVNVCGHPFCSMCLHRAMSPYTQSNCPICRHAFGHFPAVCAKLNALLQRHFPEAYAERQREAQATERELGMRPQEPEPPAPAPADYSPAELLCDCCDQLLHRPVVLLCGHVVCQSPCLRLAAAPDGSALSTCPACGLEASFAPALCKHLDELLCNLWPAEQAQRAAELAAAAAEAEAGPAAGSSSQGDVVSAVAAASPMEASDGPRGEGSGAAAAAVGEGGAEEEPSTPRAAGAGEGGGREAGEGGDEAGPSGATASPSLLAAIRRRREAGGRTARVAQRLEDNLKSLMGENYVHHGVGCDVCGRYPIQGRRYQCKDCPEAVGFDLCGPCMDRGVEAIVGRFNQQHTAQHRMELIRPRITAFHLFQAANPGLPLHQLMWLLDMQFGGGGSDDEAAAAGGQQEQQGEQQQQAAAAAGQTQPDQGQGAGGEPAGGGVSGGGGGSDSGGGEGEGPVGERDTPIPMTRWRGPRPAPDPTAVDPSPSAMLQGPQADAGEDPPGTSVVYIPLSLLLGGDEAENNVQAEGDEGEEEGGPSGGRMGEQGPGPP